MISLGGFHEVCKGNFEDGREKVLNTHVLLGADGSVLGRYSKAHLFNVDIPGGARLKEADYVVPGGEVGHPIHAAGIKIGLGVCYDLRFPEFSTALRRRGAHLLTYPSAFTVATGMAHWEVLLRARAVETQCYVVAAAQAGKHNQKRASYGHSIIIDPWGTVLAQCGGEGEDVAVAPLDLKYLEGIRTSMPVMQHRRSDLYGLGVEGERCLNDDTEDKFPFGSSGSIISK